MIADLDEHAQLGEARRPLARAPMQLDEHGRLTASRHRQHSSQQARKKPRAAVLQKTTR